MLNPGLRLALTLTLLWPQAGAAEPELIDGIAAQVDDRVVLVSEVLGKTRGQEQAMRAAGAPEAEIARLRATALDALIEQQLLERIVAKNEMEAEDEEINATITTIAEQNGLSVEQLYASVVFHGLTVEAYRAQIKGDIERRNLVQAAVGQKVEISDAQVEALFRQRYEDQAQSGEAVHVRQILRAVGGPTKRRHAAACAEAEDARLRVLGGEPFEVVARAVSDIAPQDGGDIGWLPVASVAPWMSQALEDLEPGSLSEVLKLPFGCSVLQLVERRSVEPVQLEQVREALYAELWDGKLQEEYRSWIEELREQSYIERRGYFADVGAGIPLSEPATDSQ